MQVLTIAISRVETRAEPRAEHYVRTSICIRLFQPINYDDLDRSLRRLQFQPEFFLYRASQLPGPIRAIP